LSGTGAVELAVSSCPPLPVDHLHFCTNGKSTEILPVRFDRHRTVITIVVTNGHGWYSSIRRRTRRIHILLHVRTIQMYPSMVRKQIADVLEEDVAFDSAYWLHRMRKMTPASVRGEPWIASFVGAVLRQELWSLRRTVRNLVGRVRRRRTKRHYSESAQVYYSTHVLVAAQTRQQYRQDGLVG
jgi:hypothetical protein